MKAQTAIPTFSSISLYWSPSGGSSSNTCSVKYRPSGGSWKNGYPLWYATDGQYRGSLVYLSPGTSYEIQLTLDSGITTTLNTTTWSENFPVDPNKIHYLSADTSTTLNITDSGSASGYALYAPEPGKSVTIDVANLQSYNISVSTSYVIIRGFKLTGGTKGGIYLGPATHDIVVEKNEIWNWGQGINNEGAIFGGDNYSKLNPNMKRFIIQRNIIHDPRSGSNDWRTGHPSGPQTVVLFNSGGQNVIRYNEGYSSSYSHYYNDTAGAGSNSDVGYPGADSDIYGNIFKNCYDDAIESDGFNMNVRIWGNYLSNCYTGISIAPVIKGPVYIFRNVLGILEQYQGSSPSLNQGLVKTATTTGGVSGYGRAYLFHNTILQQFPNGSNIGARSALCNGPAANVFTRNNIFQLQGSTNDTFHNGSDPTNNFNYDLYNGSISGGPAGSEINGIRSTPTYISGAGLATGYFLSPEPPGLIKVKNLITSVTILQERLLIWGLMKEVPRPWNLESTLI